MTNASASAFLSVGFRPFYLGAALFAALAVPLWYAAYAGWLALEPVLPGFGWHAHEMLFGFAPAVIVGFLLTAVRAWTGLPTPAGASLAALFLLWLAARILMMTGPGPLAVATDLAFLLVAALVLAVPLWRSGNRRNLFVVVLLLGLALLSAAHHGAYRGWLEAAWIPRAQTAAIDLVVLLLAVIGGRIIPAFSANAVPGLTPRRWVPVEVLAVGSLVGLAVLEAGALAERLPPAAMSAWLFGAGLIHLIRLLGWQPWATRGNPLLLVLPLGYLWLPVHLLLRAVLDPAPGIMSPVALHAASIGAMGGLMLAMMTRSALGHTGRPLAAGGADGLMFASIHLAALVRVAGPLLWPDRYVTWIGLSALLWTVAFAAYAAAYAPVVTRPRRVDPGQT